MADDIRERLISTAESLMRSGRKAESLTTREIAAAAGASLGSVNYHFGSKDALVAKAAERLFADFEPRWSRVAEAARAAARTAAEAVAPGNGRAGEKAAAFAALRAGKEELKAILKDLANAVDLAAGGSEFSIRRELMDGDMATTKFLAPVLRSFLPPGSDERELRRACFFIVAPLQLLFLRGAWFSEWTGIGLSDRTERDSVIDSLIDSILEPFAAETGRDLRG